MDFALTEEQRRVQAICRELAADFAKRAAEHDSDASTPMENYAALRKAGMFGLIIPKEFGGMGAGLLGYAIAAEEIAQRRPVVTRAGLARGANRTMERECPATKRGAEPGGARWISR